MKEFGRYTVIDEIGHGAMGAVYKAHDPIVERVVAIKTILAAALAGPQAEEYRERFKREARAAGTVRPAESTGHGGKESPHGRA